MGQEQQTEAVVEDTQQVVDETKKVTTEEHQEGDKSTDKKTTSQMVADVIKDLKQGKNAEKNTEQLDTATTEHETKSNTEDNKKSDSKDSDVSEKEADQAKRTELKQLYGDHDVDKAPQRWKKSAREAWDKIPLEARYAIRQNMQSQSEYIDKQTKAFKKYEGVVHEYDEIRDSVKAFSKKGQEASYIKTLINADKQAHENPLNFLVNFANSYKIDLRELVNGGVAFDSRLHKEQHHNTQLLQRVNNLEEQLKERREQDKQYHQQQIQSQEDQAAQYVQNFLDSKNQNEVKIVLPNFQYYVQQVQGEGYIHPDDILEEAYSRAFNSSLDNYKRFQKQKDDEIKQKHQAELERAKQARGIRSSTSANGRHLQKQFTSIRDAVADSYHEVFNRKR